MTDIFYLNRQTRENMRLARKCILKTYEMVKLGRDAAALRYANRAVEAYDLALRQARQPNGMIPYIPTFDRPNHAGDAA
jgi:hypothetical protein